MPILNFVVINLRLLFININNNNNNNNNNNEPHTFVVRLATQCLFGLANWSQFHNNISSPK